MHHLHPPIAGHYPGAVDLHALLRQWRYHVDVFAIQKLARVLVRLRTAVECRFHSQRSGNDDVRRSLVRADLSIDLCARAGNET